MDTRAFFFGLLTATLLCAGAYRYYLRPADLDPCRACSTGTRCAAGLCVAANDLARAQPVIRKRSGGQRPRVASNSGNAGTSPGASGDPLAPGEAPVEAPPPPPPPPPLRPEEKKMMTVGDKLTGTEVINMAEAGGAERELSQEDLDAVFRPKQPAIVNCIDEARGEAQLESLITVAFRVRRSGEVAGMRLEAPAYLITHGLNDCVRRIVMGLRFPASSKAQVATYPFSLR